MAVLRYKSLCIFLLCVLLGRGLGFFATIEPHEEECFYERAQQGSKMGLTFEVIEGGFLDIDVKVRSTGADVGHMHCSSVHSWSDSFGVSGSPYS